MVAYFAGDTLWNSLVIPGFDFAVLDLLGFLLPKYSEALVASPSGLAARFLGGCFLGVAFFGLRQR